MPVHRNILYKIFKEFIKKFGNDKNKDKNYKLNKDKNSQFFNIQLKNKFKHSKYFNGECNYYHKHEYKSQNCHKHF